MPANGPRAATKDVEHGSRDTITPSASSSLTPEEPRSTAATPTPRKSLEIEDTAQPQRTSPAWRTWSNFEARLPAPVARASRKTVGWLKGPEPPKTYQITPVLERFQTLPVRTLARLPRWARAGIFLAAFVLWAVLFAVILTNFSTPTNFAGYGAPVALSCVTSLWPNAQTCGLNGQNCYPFDNATFAFNCPANCLSARVLNPRPIGNISISYRSLVVGGQSDPAEDDAPIYRGDSFICGAAIHAGAIGNTQGGCGVVSLIGEKNNFPAISRNGINSIAYDSNFPMAFDFNQSQVITSASSHCRDPRWNLLALSTTFTALFGILTSSPATFFAPIFTIMFFQVGMASDPPAYANYQSLASTTIGRFLPAALVAALFYQYSVRKTLRNCRASLEKTILWVGGAWVGSLNNYTFDKIPISRLTGHDIRQQPGAIPALVIIILAIFAVALYQCWCFRNEGRLLRFLGLYIVLGIGLGILAALPKLTLRIHHYIIALLLLPGTALRTRVSLLCQGLLVGLFINGIARWNFDAILQTAAALRGDAQLGSAIPRILEPVINGTSITFAWESIARGYGGVSVIVNDVERFRGKDGEKSFSWQRQDSMGESPEYFRFGFVSYSLFGGVRYSDFTRAGSWLGINGTWSGIPPGRT